MDCAVTTAPWTEKYLLQPKSADWRSLYLQHCFGHSVQDETVLINLLLLYLPDQPIVFSGRGM